MPIRDIKNPSRRTQQWLKKALTSQDCYINNVSQLWWLMKAMEQEPHLVHWPIGVYDERIKQLIREGYPLDEGRGVVRFPCSNPRNVHITTRQFHNFTWDAWQIPLPQFPVNREAVLSRA